MKLYIGNLAYSVNESAVRDMFTPYGTVDSVDLITDKMSGQMKGFGFVEMPDNAEADAAIKALNETVVNGRPLRVNQAKPKEAPRKNGFR